MKDYCGFHFSMACRNYGGSDRRVIGLSHFYVACMRQLALIIYSHLILRPRVRIAHTSADSPHVPEKR
jgi:hypothetical protein